MLEPVGVARSTLYFHQWQYVVLFYLPEACHLRELNHERIDLSVIYRNEWLSRRGVVKIVGPEIAKILHQACDYLLARPNCFKKVVSGNNIWLYTNTPEDFEDIDSIPTGQILYINQAEITQTPDAVTLNNPRHAYRTYFRERFLYSDELDTLRRYFHSRSEMFRLSPGFRRIINGRRMWITKNYFVDHDEPNADFLINLAVPGIVRKTLPIVARTK